MKIFSCLLAVLFAVLSVATGTATPAPSAHAVDEAPSSFACSASKALLKGMKETTIGSYQSWWEAGAGFLATVVLDVMDATRSDCGEAYASAVAIQSWNAKKDQCTALLQDVTTASTTHSSSPTDYRNILAVADVLDDSDFFFFECDKAWNGTAIPLDGVDAYLNTKGSPFFRLYRVFHVVVESLTDISGTIAWLFEICDSFASMVMDFTCSKVYGGLYNVYDALSNAIYSIYRFARESISFAATKFIDTIFEGLYNGYERARSTTTFLFARYIYPIYEAVCNVYEPVRETNSNDTQFSHWSESHGMIHKYSLLAANRQAFLMNTLVLFAVSIIIRVAAPAEYKRAFEEHLLMSSTAFFAFPLVDLYLHLFEGTDWFVVYAAPEIPFYIFVASATATLYFWIPFSARNRQRLLDELRQKRQRIQQLQQLRQQLHQLLHLQRQPTATPTLAPQRLPTPLPQRVH